MHRKSETLALYCDLLFQSKFFETEDGNFKLEDQYSVSFTVFPVI